MQNDEIAKVFLEMADLLEIKGENPFKVRAYRRAAQIIDHLPDPIADRIARGEDLQEIPGIGEAIAKKSAELVATGKLAAYEDLKAQFPAGMIRLLEIQGIGPKTAHRLATELGIDSVAALEQALVDGRVAALPRMGEKTAQNILRQIQACKGQDRRIPIGEALPIVEEILAALSPLPGVRNLTAAGSLRRFRETVGDIDLMGTADDPGAVVAAFAGLPQIREVLARGPTKASVLLDKGLQVDLRMVEHQAFGSLLQHFTGSREHNIALRTRAQRQGLSLSEYGITRIDTNQLERFPDEEAFYRRLGLDWIPPEIREDQGEIDLAEAGGLPRLVEERDIRGDFHVHSDWSDGRSTLSELALAARARGYEYLAVTDHSVGLGIAHGLNAERLAGQRQAIEKINARGIGVRLLAGVEVDIRADGTLDLPEGLLAGLDIVIGSVHSSLQQDESRMTARLIRAVENPHVDIIAHPTGRLIGRREPAAVDIGRLIRAAADHGKALEINAMPDRLDMKDLHARRAHEQGALLALGTDAHHADQLGLMRFGIGVARRAWCTPGHLLNGRSLAEVLAFLQHR
ncbi:MAG: DNA polymerase/3'-5' exonuclease PolX [Deltaproteobacteria bacterium]|nr:DNA polymerase/3'-5' exonuclease PolX [Deltaproteobacteria bacterium]